MIELFGFFENINYIIKISGLLCLSYIDYFGLYIYLLIISY